MLRLPKPVVPETSPEILSMDQLKDLMAATAGKTFLDRRDNAIMRLFLEPGGARLSELTNLNVDGIDLGRDSVRVFGKGRKERAYPFGAKTGLALDRYLRARAGHPFGKLPDLWLGKKGPLGKSGVQQMLRRRASECGIPRLYPHMFRHTAAHEWLAAGGTEGDAVRLFGWSSPAMLQVYARSLADTRAADSARRMSLGDRY
jgi:site-specific recombinase XerC